MEQGILYSQLENELEQPLRQDEDNQLGDLQSKEWITEQHESHETILQEQEILVEEPYKEESIILQETRLTPEQEKVGGKVSEESQVLEEAKQEKEDYIIRQHYQPGEEEVFANEKEEKKVEGEESKVVEEPQENKEAEIIQEEQIEHLTSEPVNQQEQVPREEEPNPLQEHLTNQVEAEMVGNNWNITQESLEKAPTQEQKEIKLEEEASNKQNQMEINRPDFVAEVKSSVLVRDSKSKFIRRITPQPLLSGDYLLILIKTKQLDSGMKTLLTCKVQHSYSTRCLVPKKKKKREVL
jgi:hypothetical protein